MVYQDERIYNLIEHLSIEIWLFLRPFYIKLHKNSSLSLLIAEFFARFFLSSGQSKILMIQPFEM